MADMGFLSESSSTKDVDSNIPKRLSLELIDEKGKIHNNINLLDWEFIPNYMFSKIKRFIVPKNPDKSGGLEVIYDSSLYDTRKLSLTKSKKYPCPIIHTMTRKGNGLRYSKDGCLSKKRNKTHRTIPSTDHFGIPKVILNFNEILYPYNDYKGEYGLSQLSFGIQIDSKADGDKIIKGLNSPIFKEIVKATKWGSFQTDWRMFRYFRKDFYDYV